MLWNAQDYRPFGEALRGRSYVGLGYRYGFNGKEKDSEGEWGNLTHYDYGFRIYNPSVGRFLSVDPLTASYPYYTPYQFAGNNPIEFIDLDGLERYHYLRQIDDNGNAQLNLIGVEDITKKVKGDGLVWHGNSAVQSYKEVVDNSTQEHMVHVPYGLMTDEGTPLWNPYIPSGEKIISFNTVEEMLAAPDSDFERSTGDVLGEWFSGIGMMNLGSGGKMINGVRGFKSYGQMKQFGSMLQAGFAKRGFRNVKVFMQGSSTTGRSFKTGVPFDINRVSDFDVALASDNLFAKAKELGLVDKLTKSVPIEAGTKQAEALGIDNLLTKLSEMMKRPVNVRIFKDEKAVRETGKTIAIPTQEGF